MLPCMVEGTCMVSPSAVTVMSIRMSMSTSMALLSTVFMAAVMAR